MGICVARPCNSSFFGMSNGLVRFGLFESEALSKVVLGLGMIRREASPSRVMGRFAPLHIALGK